LQILYVLVQWALYSAEHFAIKSEMKQNVKKSSKVDNNFVSIYKFQEISILYA
jgi:hypothetical protein